MYHAAIVLMSHECLAQFHSSAQGDVPLPDARTNPATEDRTRFSVGGMRWFM